MASVPSEKDLQELLRLLTTTRKLPILQAMSQVRALQAASLRSIRQIAEAPAEAVQVAIKDVAGAKALQTSCKAAVKKMDKAGMAGTKRPAGSQESQEGNSSSAESKRARPSPAQPAAGGLYLPVAMTPADLEKSLDLAVEEDDDRMAATVLLTNRAPLLLAFAVELLRYTMPEQPPSSRLSLAQAVVSANARSKAVSLGIARERGRGSGSGEGSGRGNSNDDDWGAGQPRVRIMGREVAVLKRGGYTWRGEEDVEGVDEVQRDNKDEKKNEPETGETPSLKTVPATESQLPPPTGSRPAPGVWSVSSTISLRGSVFVAHATTMTDATQRTGLIRGLIAAHPRLLTATHNAWASRVRAGGPDSDYADRMRQDAYDDGESGCGDFMLRVLAELAAVDILVVLTRWYGGTMLGPDRWRLMRNCVTGALADRLRRTGAEVTLGGEALWALDLEGRTSSSTAVTPGSSLTAVVGMATHRPEAARQYLLKSFASAEEGAAPGAVSKKRKTVKALDAEKEDNLALLLGALRLLYDSWADHLTPAELDRRAWSWYVAVRPDVDVGPAGWGAKARLRLSAILALRRPAPSKA
ncbi:impact protein-like protein [Grosmannia clavigera kw1407]|uniref:Impact protein-like protein n=1 Tax=Grosmannia clavigera (strain kw1407 / UAMH 11150) TaxID=655863 RepID=F0XCA8_GROCL|nr:impact protein-like protein [Grosmannia clavigera kw1407]EFX04307.1 impact protein-like protein [Grosmannia clavigera kw1407]